MKVKRKQPLSYLQNLVNLAAVARAIAAGGAPTADQLAELVDVSRPSVHRYLNTLRELGAPLPVDPAQRGYRFTRPWNFGRALLAWVEAQAVPPEV